MIKYEYIYIMLEGNSTWLSIENKRFINND